MQTIALLVLVALVFTLSTACESSVHAPTEEPDRPTPTNEPDRPTFAEGEAIAVVQTWLGGCLFKLNLHGVPSWAETYLGNGQWEVALDSPIWGHITWRVFELSRSISIDLSGAETPVLPC